MRPGRRTEALRLTALSVLGALGFLAACAPVPPQADVLTLERVAFDRLPGWTAGRQAEALAALARSCERLVGEDGAAFGPGPAFGTVGDWRAACAARPAAESGDGAARAYFERWFTPYLATNRGAGEGLFTGYYEAELHGARRRGGRHTVPIYRRPPDLVGVDLGLFRHELRGERLSGRVVDGRLRPYATRAEIEDGTLAGRGLELAWVDDPVDAFFLHIQGSGRVVLEDGEVMRVGYAGDNGHPYVSVGRLLLDRGELGGGASMQAIRAWMAAHPGEAREVRAENPRYVFFRELSGDGPLGAQGVVLTPERSLAVDTAFVPLGVPLWLDAGGLRRLMVAQDRGGAIKGPVRGDVFWGFGDEAARRAGSMSARGGYYLLLPRAAAGRAPVS